MKFNRKNLPILIALKKYEVIIKAMEPMITHHAYKFSVTNMLTNILDKEDYEQLGREAILEACQACKKIKIDKKNNTMNYEGYWSKFIALCQLKLRSKLISNQKKYYHPLHVSQRSASLHPKVHKAIEEHDVDSKYIQDEFNVSPKIAEELINMVESEFEDNQLIDIPVQENVRDSIYIEEILEHLTEEERNLVQSLILDGVTIKMFSKDNNISTSMVSKKLKTIKEKLREIITNDTLC